ncbi:MAG: NUDIX hydrolase [Gemmatimonadaceae bacterium]|nr:NUDIX hydrolase [Gemmatimonadaceae bacterium]
MKNDVLISTTRLYDGKIIKLDLDRIRFPDGSEGEMAVVRHQGASAIVPFLSDPGGADPDLLLLRQYRYAGGGYLYEIPAGRLDAGESPIDCARRELREETGCTAESVQEMCAPLMTPGFADERIHIFLATGLTRGETAYEADEFAEVHVLKLSRALIMIEHGEIVDAKTIIGLLFAAGFRLRA